METPIKMDDLEVPQFLETPTWVLIIIGELLEHMLRESHYQTATECT